MRLHLLGSTFLRQQADAAGSSQNNSTVSGGNDTAAGGDGGDKTAEDFLDTNAGLWDTPKGKEPDPVAEAAAQAAMDAKAQKTNQSLDAYVKSMDFGLKFDEAKVIGEDGKVDTNYLNTSIVGGMQTMYRKFLTDVANIQRESETRLRGEMDAAAKTRLRASDAEKSLIAAVPIAAKAAVLPVATALKAQFIKAGKKDTEANDAVKQFFAEMGAAVQDDTDAGLPPRTRPGTTRANGTPGETVQDWGKILRGE